MDKKICTKCRIKKNLDKFSPDKKAKDKKESWCKECRNFARKERSKKYPWKTIYQHIKQRCNNPKCKRYKDWGGRGIKCLITEKEVKKLWFRDKAYEMKCASIDRENNNGNYCFENCRFIELVENSARQDKTSREKPVNQYTLQGDFIRSWKSMMEIERHLGFANTNISKACSGKRKTAYKFIWKLINKGKQ